MRIAQIAWLKAFHQAFAGLLLSLQHICLTAICSRHIQKHKFWCNDPGFMSASLSSLLYFWPGDSAEIVVDRAG